MKISNSIKVLGLGVLAAGLLSTSFAANRVGPVSQYGQLQAGKNSAGKGQIYGACKGVADGAEVAVQGMSLFWSISSDVGSPFWTAEHVNKLVKDQKIQLIRAPMGVDEDWGSGNYFTNEGYYKGLMNTVVQAAIDNDIYVIIDYHSHHAADDVNKAKSFFGTMAQKWGAYDNVIFEIFNEPLQGVAWSSIKTYADAVVETIRQYSDNLIVVGSRSWDQYPNDAASAPVTDAKNNTAYTFHFYAGSHYTNSEGANAVSAMNSGLSVFVTEWGTVDASGDGGFNASNSTTWYNWMKTHKLSGANWSVSNKAESASYYTGSADNPSYTTSGQWVNSNVFASLPQSYTACDGAPASSSSIASSSSALPSGYTDYIDDLEDGDGYTFTGGEWYAYTDMADKGASTISNDEGAKGGYDVVIAGSKAGNSTKYVAGITGINLSQGGNKYDPYVALGLALNEKQTAYDLSACTQISYKYKGAAHNFKVEDTAVLDYGFHQIHKSASDTWTTATIPWDMLSQEAWPDPVELSKKRINKFTWEVKGVAETTTQPKYNYLYVDDVRCSGWAIQPVPSPVSSSSSAKSSSSVASSSSAKSSSSVASSSSAKSSSSIASSSSAKSSSSVASSSSAKSSSSVASSSSVRSSSSAKSSSSAATQVVVVGDLEQTVAQGGQFETVTFKNVQTFNRNTWNLHFFNIEQSGSEVTVAGSVPNYVQVGDHTETLTINNTQFEIKLTVTAAASSSSASVENTSSSSVEGSSSSESTTVVNVFEVNPLKVSMTGRMLQVSGAERASVDVFDMQGSPVASFKQVTGSVSLENLRQGNYIVRVRSGSMNLTRRIAIK